MAMGLPFPLSVLVLAEDVVLRECQNLAKCSRCGAWVDCEDLGQVDRHSKVHTKPFLGEFVVLSHVPHK